MARTWIAVCLSHSFSFSSKHLKLSETHHQMRGALSLTLHGYSCVFRLFYCAVRCSELPPNEPVQGIQCRDPSWGPEYSIITLAWQHALAD